MPCYIKKRKGKNPVEELTVSAPNKWANEPKNKKLLENAEKQLKANQVKTR
jgi:hypothetical protein